MSNSLDDNVLSPRSRLLIDGWQVEEESYSTPGGDIITRFSAKHPEFTEPASVDKAFTVSRESLLLGRMDVVEHERKVFYEKVMETAREHRS